MKAIYRFPIHTPIYVWSKNSLSEAFYSCIQLPTSIWPLWAFLICCIAGWLSIWLGLHVYISIAKIPSKVWPRMFYQSVQLWSCLRTPRIASSICHVLISMSYGCYVTANNFWSFFCTLPCYCDLVTWLWLCQVYICLGLLNGFHYRHSVLPFPTYQYPKAFTQFKFPTVSK